jgi:ferredoxin
MRPHQVVVDHERCVGSGLCVASMPELFELDDNCVSTPRNGGQVAADLADLATAAAELCPANAIALRPASV